MKQLFLKTLFIRFLMFLLIIQQPPRPTLFPYTNALPISLRVIPRAACLLGDLDEPAICVLPMPGRDALRDDGALRVLAQDRKSTRLNSSHVSISYAVFCLKKKTASC